jgi:Cdc6-like AAA superfamily ATPase
MDQNIILPSFQKIHQKLDYFYMTNKIPNIIFHGSSGTGKRTIVYDFLNKIYQNNKQKIKTNVMFVNCAHGKGIKFIREELKFFAKTNIQSNSGVLFKSIVLLNADFLTVDAQSALRRCIELFSYNTRFFIIIENKNKLLNPILSRFCEIYIPEYIHNDKIVNLHQYNLGQKYQLQNYTDHKIATLAEKMKTFAQELDPVDGHAQMIDFSVNLYESGFSCIDIIDWLENDGHLQLSSETIISDVNENTESIIMYYHKIRGEFRCEKMLLFYLLDIIFFRSKTI